MLTTLLALISLSLYSGAALLPAQRLARGPDYPLRKSAMLGLGALAVLCHGLVIYLAVVETQGLNLRFFGAASAIGWLMALLTLLAAVDRPVANLLILILPLAGVTALLGTIPAPAAAQPPPPAGLLAHVYSSMLAYSVLAIAAIHALLLALQDHKLRTRHPGGFVRLLPPLQTMEDLLFQMLRLGFLLLTGALVTGFIFLNDMFAQHVAHKTVLSIIAWVVFGTLLLGRRLYGWRGQTAIRWTVIGFLALMLGFFGSMFVRELLLNRLS